MRSYQSKVERLPKQQQLLESLSEELESEQQQLEGHTNTERPEAEQHPQDSMAEYEIKDCGGLLEQQKDYLPEGCSNPSSKLDPWHLERAKELTLEEQTRGYS